jgi:hypothetical protein
MTTRVSTSVLANTAVTPGIYGGGVTSASVQVPVIQVDQQGRLSSAANVTVTSTSIYANTGQLTANAAVGIVQLGLPSTGVIAGNYGSGTTTPVLTIDAYGRITGATTTLITGGSAGIGATTYTRTTYTATAGQTSFAATYTVGYVQVYHNGILLAASDYTASSGTSIVLGAGARVNDIIDIFAYTVTLVNNLSPSYAGGQGGAAGVVLYQSAANTTSNTAVGTSTYLLQSNGSGAPTWVNPGSLSVNFANTSTSATSATSAGTFTSTSQNSQFNSVGVGTAASATTGEIRATNNITAYYSSDRKFKENIQEIPNALEKVDAIGGKLYDWTDEYIQDHGGEDGYFVQKADFGVIAQDVQSVFSIATRTRPDGSLAVDYEKLCALAFAAIKELKSEVEVLKGQIK